MIDLLFGDKDLRFLLYIGIGSFLVLGFLWEPITEASHTGERAEIAELTETNSLEKIDWQEISPDIRNYMTQGYGRTNFAAVNGGLLGNRHNGIDIRADYGAAILSQSDGRIFFVGDQDKYCLGRGYGKFVMVSNNDREYTLLYAHLSKASVSEGEKVKRGDTLGYVGRTGLTTGPHLHFSVFKTNVMNIDDDSSCGPKPVDGEVNPLNYL